MSRSLACFIACLASLAVVDAATATAESKANPIRKVVNLLMNMQKKVAQDGKKAEVLFNKFMCYCETGAGSLQKQVSEAEDRIPQLKSSIEESSATHQQLSEELKGHKADRAEAKEAIQTANALRTKEAAAFAKESTELKANIDAVGRAIEAISKGVAGFLQTRTASIVRQLVVSMDMSGSDRDMLSAFLSVSASSDNTQQYAPQSGEILGILKQMADEMQKDLVDLQDEENSQIGLHASLISAKTKEIGAASKAIESKIGRIGNLAVEIATLKNDLEDTSESLAEDQKFLSNLGKMCAKKKQEWTLYQKTQAEELVAIAETIKILNDDDALDLFKKTLPTPGAGTSEAASSFLQVRTETKDPMKRHRAIQALAAAGRGDRRLALLALALRGKKAGFGEVLKMIGELMALLKKEQVGDDSKKEWCLSEIDKTEDAVKGLKRDVSDIEKAIAEAEDATASLSSEIQVLTKGIQDLDKQVDEATQQRKEENSEYVESLAASNAAQSLLDIAKNRLNKFYNAKLYVAPAKRELSEEQRITVNMGGTLDPTSPPGGIAGTGIEGFLQVSARTRRSDDEDAPPPAPEANLNYNKKGQESGGVIAMIDLLKADLERQIQELEMTEKEAQSDYETFMTDSSEKRALDSKTLADKEGAKAELQAQVQGHREDLKSNKADLAGTIKELADLHQSCDWLLKNFDLRKEARNNEIDSLNKASAVLSGADYSF